jgi:iron complex outermembrane receptor protein
MRKQIILLFSALLLLFLMAVSVFAETDRKAVTLETVVVTAKKPEEPLQTGDVDLKETTGFVSVIKREDFAGKMEDLAEVLQKEAAVQIRKSGWC